jgi:hypothetical protein
MDTSTTSVMMRPIKHVEELWMMVHQCVQMLNTRLINKVEVRGIVCEERLRGELRHVHRMDNQRSTLEVKLH